MPVHAVTTADEGSVGYNRKNPVSSADDFTWDNANVYFLLTDRFYNGDTSNDHSYGRALDANGNPLSGWQSAPGTFHGGDFAGITKNVVTVGCGKYVEIWAEERWNELNLEEEPDNFAEILAKLGL